MPGYTITTAKFRPLSFRQMIRFIYYPEEVYRTNLFFIEMPQKKSISWNN
jgi:hypothetical protein